MLKSLKTTLLVWLSPDIKVLIVKSIGIFNIGAKRWGIKVNVSKNFSTYRLGLWLWHFLFIKLAVLYVYKYVRFDYARRFEEWVDNFIPRKVFFQIRNNKKVMLRILCFALSRLNHWSHILCVCVYGFRLCNLIS